MQGRPRKGWNQLSPAQRGRYLSAGRSGRLTGEPYLDEAEVRAFYEADVGTLAGARGHRAESRSFVRPAWAAPGGPTDRAQINLLDTASKDQLAKWRRSRRAPRWLPRSPETFRTDVAAILSQIDVGPKRWRRVEVRPKGNGRYLLTIEVSRRKERFTTTLPDADAVTDLGRLLNDASRAAMAMSPQELKRLNTEWGVSDDREPHIVVDISGTDVPGRAANRAPAPIQPSRGPAALPAKKAPVKPAPKPVKKAAKKAVKKAVKKRRRRATNLAGVRFELLDLQALLSPLEVASVLPKDLLKRLEDLTRDVERLIG